MLLALLLFDRAYGQAPLSLDVFPAAPNATALTKFGDIPVGLANGIPSVNVPVYSYKRNGLNFNVSLDYHAGGIKVEEVASDVGIGWALNAGGVISRTVRGWPDDHKQAGYFYLGNLQPFGHYLSNAWADSNFSSADSLWLFFKNTKDSQSDIFHYSLNGKSGKFIFGLDGSYVTIPQSNIKIKRILDPSIDNDFSLKGFVITDTDGATYEYMKGDKLYNTSMNIHSAYSYPTSWNLTKVVAPFKTDSIGISYENTPTEYQLGLSESKYTWKQGAYDFSDPTLSYHGYSHGDYSGMVNRIKRIAFPDSTSITFSYNSIARKDIATSGALNEVTINGGGSSRGYRLYQSYGANGAYSAGAVSPIYRLQLDSVAQFSGSSQLPSHRFTYNGTMPSRISTLQDHWGFAYGPGRSNSSTLIPQIRLSADDVITGADRTPDSLYAHIGSLASVQYPTGGSTTFTYESNRGDSKLDFTDVQNISINMGAITQEPTFVVNRTGSATIVFNFSMFTWCPQSSTSCSFIYKIKSLDGLTTYASATFAYSELGTVKQVSSNLPNGSYKLTAEFDYPGSCTCDDMIGFTLSYNQLSNNSDRLAGGIRVKKTVDYNGIDHNNDVIKEYSYKKADGSSSGTVSMAPLYHYDYTAYTMLPGHTLPQPSDWYYRNSSAFHPLSSVNGSPVSYTRVTVQQKNGLNVNLGRTVHEFKGYNDIDLVPCMDDQGGNCPPFVHQPVKDYGLGLPISERVYHANNLLLKKSISVYNHIQSNAAYETDNFRSFKFISTSTPEIGGLTSFATFVSTDFYVHTGRMEKLRETVVDYSSASDSLVSVSEYSYDPNYYNLQKFHTFDSRGQKTERRMYYPYDYSVGGAIAKLATDNVLYTVVSTEDWFTDVNNVTTLKAADITDFGLFNSTIVRPSRYLQLNNSQTLSLATIGAFNPSLLNRNSTYFKEQLFYDRFNVKGAIQEHHVKDGTRTSLLYSYNGQMPIAEIKNATYAAVESALGAPAIASFSNLTNPDRAAVDAFLAPLKLALPDAFITSYVYQPTIGLSSQVDAKGMKTSYEYDVFGRLSLVKDHNGNILKNYRYNYKP